MIKSMTGFAKSNLIENLREYQIEIKSVNHRYLDILVRVPKQLTFLEDLIKKEISARIKRGKIEVSITFQDNNQDTKKLLLNKEIAKNYITQLKELAEETNTEANIQITEIVKLPDVLSVLIEQDDDKIKQDVIKITDQAVDKLIEMRTFEGNKIAEDLKLRIHRINEKIEQISAISTGLIEEYVVKLEKRIKEILKTEEVDKNRIAQEVVIYADKCSIEEEITRLKSHSMQFEKLLYENEAVGKKLDFLIQEMNRETNTIGSKANSLEIVNNVVDIKTELENIREQIQNIE